MLTFILFILFVNKHIHEISYYHSDIVNKTVHNITLWKPDKKQPRGRPRKRWSDRVKDDLKLLGIQKGEQLSKNRELWRGVIKAPMDL
jgi:hypothetical protein